MAKHHPAEELLVDYAGGAVTGGEAAIIATHLAMCPQCRVAAGMCEAIGGALLDAIEPRALPTAVLTNMLAGLHDADCSPAAKNTKTLGACIGIEPKDAQWHRVGQLGLCKLPGCTEHDQLWFVRVSPGKTAPQHRHTGDEWTVVLEGGFSDNTGSYAAGDFLIAPDGSRHRPVADLTGACVCLVMLRGAPYFTNPFVRLFMRLFD